MTKLQLHDLQRLLQKWPTGYEGLRRTAEVGLVEKDDGR